MNPEDKVNILLVDDQPAKLLSYEAILSDLGANLVKANSAKEALELLLKMEIAVILVDVCMPELDGFELAQMIRNHPRFQKTAIIFISAIQIADDDRLRGYEMGAVDYVPVPVIPEVLRAKVRIFSELYSKTRQLEHLNQALERRVAERTAELEASFARLLQSEQRRNLALAAGQMGSWNWDLSTNELVWDEGQHRIFGVEPGVFKPDTRSAAAMLHPDDRQMLRRALRHVRRTNEPYQAEFRLRRPNGHLRWCLGIAAASFDDAGVPITISGVTVDITDRKEAEERQTLLAREVDHRARNALAITQAIVRLTRAPTLAGYISAVQGRIAALARTHTLLSEARWQGADLASIAHEELSPYKTMDTQRIVISGPTISLRPAIAQSLALVLHELATNAAKYGALSSQTGSVNLSWALNGGGIVLQWEERGGPLVQAPTAEGLGSEIVKSSTESQLRGTVRFDWQQQGLRCTLSFPIENSERYSAPSAAAGEHENCSSKFPLRLGKGSRVLLVEDEALVARMMKDVLAELHLSVIGPVGRLDEAVATVQRESLDAAILDVNLDGEFVYPAAEILNARGTPFVFVTGYGVESIDKRFAHIPVLKKPVEREMIEKIFAKRNVAVPEAAA